MAEPGAKRLFPTLVNTIGSDPAERVITFVCITKISGAEIKTLPITRQESFRTSAG